jgi:hypothetical protein
MDYFGSNERKREKKKSNGINLNLDREWEKEEFFSWNSFNN